MDQKRLFIAAYQRGALPLTELCRRYGVSRPTGYKWIQRFEEEGPPGLQERSRRPKGCSHETAIEITEAILELRRRHPFWGRDGTSSACPPPWSLLERILKVEDALGRRKRNGRL